jgi:hypothetical protein
VGRQGLLDLAGIVLNEVLTGSKDLRGAPVVEVQDEDLGGVEDTFEVEDVPDR